VPPFDREGALKSAEKALKLGRIDAADMSIQMPVASKKAPRSRFRKR